MEDFNLDGRDFVELNNLLKLTGLCPSGGHAKMVISAGQVKVDGQIELRKRCKIRSQQIMEFEGRQIRVL